MPFEVRYFLTDGGRDVFIEWILGIRDVRTRVAITRRVNRLRTGNFGDHAFCGEGVWELRIDGGPGYSVYYARIGRDAVLLLGGGDKRSQTGDISTAIESLRKARRRLTDAE